MQEATVEVLLHGSGWANLSKSGTPSSMDENWQKILVPPCKAACLFASVPFFGQPQLGATPAVGHYKVPSCQCTDLAAGEFNPVTV